MNDIVCGVDFGTSNSTIGISKKGEQYLIPLFKDSMTEKSVLFWDQLSQKFFVGTEAIEIFKEGEEGRYFQSLKKYLSAKEEVSTLIGTKVTSAKRYYLTDLISIILKSIKDYAEHHERCEITAVTMGRPVHYNDHDQELDRLAQDRMEIAAKKAGFKEVDFQYEPVAAALSYEKTLTSDENVLVCDIGGGTSDFSIVQVGPSYSKKFDKKNDILANSGVYVGGDNFDSRIMTEHVTSYLGKGSQYKSYNKWLDIPAHFYHDVSQWHLIHFLNNAKNAEALKNFILSAQYPEKVKRLEEMIFNNKGYHVFDIVESAKIDLTQNEATQIQADFFETPFELELSRDKFENSIEQQLDDIEKALHEVSKQSGLTKDQIDTVILVGGSTLIPSVKNIFTKHYKKNIAQQNIFTSVGYGLAINSERLAQAA